MQGKDLSTSVDTIYAAAEVIGTAFVAFGMGLGIGRSLFSSKYGKEAYEGAVANMEQLRASLDSLRQQQIEKDKFYGTRHGDQEKRIEGLTNEIKIIKALPLQELKDDYHKIADTMIVQTGILTGIQELLAKMSTASTGGSVVNIHEAKA